SNLRCYRLRTSADRTGGFKEGVPRMPPDIFDPAHYAGVRLPSLEAETLPSWAYTSRAFYEREVETIFMKVWNFIGRADHIPDPGDYFTLELVGVPIIVVRDQQRQLRAF